MGKYDKIIHLPHPVSRNRPRLSMYQRAAQFAPFAALTGHNTAINETARLTDQRIELSESESGLLNLKLALLKERIHAHPAVSITYFIPDEYKEGGQYTTHSGTVRSWKEYEQAIAFEDGTLILGSDIIDIRGDIFDKLPL